MRREVGRGTGESAMIAIGDGDGMQREGAKGSLRVPALGSRTTN